MLPIILVHGGAGDIPDSRVEGKIKGVKLAASVGYEKLKNGGSVLDAVEAAVVSMEKDENFNAGYGSVLNLDGKVEMEASIQRGSDLNVGGVTLVTDFAHPISIARKVLEKCPHSLLGGEGARRFALKEGFQPISPKDLITKSAQQALQNAIHATEKEVTEIGSRDQSSKASKPDVGTVGAVAVDTNGYIAVATSTGGMSGKVVGRIGDTPQIGSGTYADDLIAGVSTTGNGEAILKYCLAHAIVKLIEGGLKAQEATTKAVEGMTSRLNKTAGAITISKTGDVGIHFSSERMSWAYISNDNLTFGIEKGQKSTETYVAANFC